MKAFQGHLRIFLSLLFRLCGDVKNHLRKEFVIVVIASVGSIVAQLCGFITTLRYASALQRKGAGAFLEKLFPAIDGQIEAVVVALSVGVFLSLSSYLGYKGRTTSVAVAAKYEQLCFFRVLDFLKQENLTSSRPYSSSAIQVIISTNSKICGSALRSLFSAIFPTFLFLVSMAVAFVISPAITGLLLVVLLFAIPLVYKINKSGLSAANRLAKVGGNASREKSNLVKKYLLGGQAENERLPAFQAALDAYKDRVGSGEKSKSTVQGFIAFSFVFLILYVGVSVDEGGLSFEYIVGYFLALRFGLNGLVALSSIFSGFSLLSIKIKEYFDLLDSFGGSIEDTFTFEISEFPIAFVAEEELGKVELAYLHNFLLLKGAYLYLDGISKVEIKRKFGCWSDTKKSLFFDWLNEFSVDIPGKEFDDLSDVEFYLVRTAFCKIENPDVIYLDQQKLASLPNEARQFVKSYIRERSIVYAYQISSFKRLKHGETYVFWVDSKRIKSCSNKEFNEDKKFWCAQITGSVKGREQRISLLPEEDEFV